MKELFKWLSKYLWRPISSFVNRVLGNHLIQSLISYFSFKLLETNKANQYLANVMFWFALLALILWLSEKIFGIKTPLINVGKFFKIFRNSMMLENPQYGESYDMAYEGSKKMYKKLERMKRIMKKIIVLIFKYLWANKLTESGILFVGYFYYTLVEKLFNTYHVWDYKAFTSQSNYFYVMFILYTVGLIVGLYSTNSKGMETIKDWLSRVNYKKLAKFIRKLENVTDLKLMDVDEVKKWIRLANKYLMFFNNAYLITEKEYNYFQLIIDKVQETIENYEADEIVKRRELEERILARRNKQTQPPQQYQRPQSPHKVGNKTEILGNGRDTK